MSLRKPKAARVGPFQISLGQLTGDKYNPIKLDTLPQRWEFGEGIVTEIELYLDGQITVPNADDPIPFYQLHRLLDWQVKLAGNLTIVDRLGWHDPIREYMQFGRFEGQGAADISPGGGGGSTDYARIFTKRVSFVEPRAKDPYFRCFPVGALRQGQLLVKPYTSPQEVQGSHMSWSDLTLTVYVKILDVPANAVPLGSLVLEGFLDGDKDPEPSVGPGQYLRQALVLDPATDTFSDDLSSITKVDFGAPGDAGILIPDRDVVQHVREWNDENSRDPKPYLGTLTGVQEQFQFLNPTANVSGKLHAIPLVSPKPGEDFMKNAPNWSAAPGVRINDRNRSGTPNPLSFVYDIFLDRTPKMLKDIMEATKERSFAKGGVKVFPGYDDVRSDLKSHAPLAADFR